MKTIKNQSGITLVALVVTIIVLMILASISIGAIFSEKGIIQQAKDTKKQHEDVVKKEEENLNDLLGEYRNSMNGSGFANGTGGGSSEATPTPSPEEPKGPNGKPLPGAITEIVNDTTLIEDKNGNPIVLPGGFKGAVDSGNTVEEGIVVEDIEGNQFVWIPVSNINHDGSNKIKKNDGTEVEITLGRYTFDTTTGAAIVSQYAENYETPEIINTYYRELTTSRIGSSTTYNTTAKNLQEFIESVRDNHGFFLGRYEASFASGTKYGVRR